MTESKREFVTPTPELRDQAVCRLLRGWSYRAVADELHLNRYTVRDWAQQIRDGKRDRHGLVPEENQSMLLEDRYEPEFVGRVLNMHRNGSTQREIAKTLHCSVWAVRHTLRTRLPRKKTDSNRRTIRLGAKVSRDVYESVLLLA